MTAGEGCRQQQRPTRGASLIWQQRWCTGRAPFSSALQVWLQSDAIACSDLTRQAHKHVLPACVTQFVPFVSQALSGAHSTKDSRPGA